MTVKFKEAPTAPKSNKRKLVNLDFDPQPGMELTYKDGVGSCTPVVYEGASDRGMHKIRQADGSSIIVDESQLLKMHQPDLTNIP